MASIHQRKNSPYWYAAYYLPDGRRTFRSTGTASKRKALAICVEYDKAARLASQGRFNESRARSAIADIFAIGNEEELLTESTESFLESWLEKKRLEVKESSFPEYRNATKLLISSLGKKASKPIDSVTVKDITKLRSQLMKEVSGVTVNKKMTILRGAWTEAQRSGLVTENVFARVGRVKARRSNRRAFTLDEVRELLDHCTDEWKGIVLMGLYTGQRLADIARMTWRHVDLTTDTITFMTGKTGRRMKIPIAQPLKNQLMTMSSADTPAAPLFPHATESLEERGSASDLSKEFNGILKQANLVAGYEPPRERGKKKDRRHIRSELSFHCLRHTATSLLKNAGVSDVVAREIIGHDSEAVSRVYTHIEEKALRKAVGKLPNVL